MAEMQQDNGGNTTKRNQRKGRVGVVVSDSADKTLTVKV